MPHKSSNSTLLYTASRFSWVITSRPSGLCSEAASLAKKRLVEMPILHESYSPISALTWRLISRPTSFKSRFKCWVPEKSMIASSIEPGTTSGD